MLCPVGTSSLCPRLVLFLEMLMEWLFCGRFFPEESPGAGPGLPWSAAFEFCLPAAEVASVTNTYLQDVLVWINVPQGCGAEGEVLLSFSNTHGARTALMPLFK